MMLTDKHEGPWADSRYGGPWTRHGHKIPGRTVLGELTPDRARCGGVMLCRVCKDDAAQERTDTPARPPAPALTAAEAATVARFDAAEYPSEVARERVAQAMWDALHTDVRWWETVEPVKDRWRAMADAALAVLAPVGAAGGEAK